MRLAKLCPECGHRAVLDGACMWCRTRDEAAKKAALRAARSARAARKAGEKALRDVRESGENALRGMLAADKSVELHAMRLAWQVAHDAKKIAIFNTKSQKAGDAVLHETLTAMHSILREFLEPQNSAVSGKVIRYRRIKENGGRLSLGLTEHLLNVQQGLCACCGQPLEEDYHLDHIVPLAKGGRNSDENMQLLLPTCNQTKHAKDPIEFMKIQRPEYVLVWARLLRDRRKGNT